MKFFRLLRRYWVATVGPLLLLLVLVWGTNTWMISSTGPVLFDDIAKIPENKVALVMGTGPLTGSGETNLHFLVRMDAAAALYYSGKVRHLLLSGCNEPCSFNEPQEMKRALMKKGIPESAITLDDKGLRTLDSILRVKRVFGQDKVTIVTQRFHGFRAAFLSKAVGLDAVVFCADKLPWKWEFRVGLRETVARVRAVVDTFILQRGQQQPQEKIPLNA